MSAFRVLILFDGDPAGRKAAFAAMGVLAGEHVDSAIVPLPDGADPDSLSRGDPATLARLLGVPEPHVCSAAGKARRRFARIVARCRPLPAIRCFRAVAAMRRWRDAWPYRCDRAAVASWRARGPAERARAAEDDRIVAAVKAREDAARRSAELARMAAERARLGLDVPGARGGDVLSRASRYLATVDGGDSGSAFRGALVLVRGFALDEGDALALMLTEYAPRFHRALPRVEVIGMVRRAARSALTLGYLLTAQRSGR